MHDRDDRTREKQTNSLLCSFLPQSFKNAIVVRCSKAFELRKTNDRSMYYCLFHFFFFTSHEGEQTRSVTAIWKFWEYFSRKKNNHQSIRSSSYHFFFIIITAKCGVFSAMFFFFITSNQFQAASILFQWYIMLLCKCWTTIRQ